ncbi:MAG: hypothetical protein LBG49_03395 [Mycoplasmataceae bacterium]|nr:hypothetical protein [Mycoplasmataceae bacterium]
MEAKKTNRTIVVYSKKESLDKNGKRVILVKVIDAINNLAEIFPQTILLEDKTFATEIKLAFQNIVPYDIVGSLDKTIDLLKKFNDALAKLPVSEQNKLIAITSHAKKLCAYAEYKNFKIDIKNFQTNKLNTIISSLIDDLTVFLKNINTYERKIEFIANKISEFADCHKIDASVVRAFNLFNVFRDFDNIFLGFNVVRHNEIIKLLRLEKQHEAKIFKAKKKAIKKVQGFKARWKQMDLLLDEQRKTIAERKKPKFYLFTTYKWSMPICKLAQMSIKNNIVRNYQCYSNSGWAASMADANNPIVIESLKKWVTDKIG